MQKKLFNHPHNQDSDRAVINNAIKTLTKIIEPLSIAHTGDKWENHDKLCETFQIARNSLDKLPDRNWEVEIELKTAYNTALDVLETSFNTVIAELRKPR